MLAEVKHVLVDGTKWKCSFIGMKAVNIKKVIGTRLRNALKEKFLIIWEFRGLEVFYPKLQGVMGKGVVM